MATCGVHGVETESHFSELSYEKNIPFQTGIFHELETVRLSEACQHVPGRCFQKACGWC